MSACTYSLLQKSKILLPTVALLLASCGAGNSNIQPETTHSQEAAENADEIAEGLEGEQSGNETAQTPNGNPNETDGDDSTSNAGSISVTDYETAAAVACDASDEEMQKSILRRVNEARLSGQICGTTNFPAAEALTWNTLLANAATNHGSDMANNNFFSHTGSDGLKVDHRAENAGYLWLSVGENIAAGQRDTDIVMQGWLESEGHCENIMSKNYSEVAVSCVTNENADYSRYWVMVLGAPLPR